MISALKDGRRRPDENAPHQSHGQQDTETVSNSQYPEKQKSLTAFRCRLDRFFVKK